jgi:hypothetical protein
LDAVRPATRLATRVKSALAVRNDRGSVRDMLDDRLLREKVLELLRPYASNWSGSLRRGDLVIPQIEVSRLVEEISTAVQEALDARSEASELTLFHFLAESRRLASVQDQAMLLRERFVVVERKR